MSRRKYFRYAKFRRRNYRRFTIFSLIALSFKFIWNIGIFSFSVISAIILTIIEMAKNIKRYIKNSKYLHQIGISYVQIEELIKSMSGREFEVFLSHLYRAIGYSVTLTQESCDGGKDLILYRKDEGYTYVEAKRYSDSNIVGREILQKLVGSATADKIPNMICINTGKYNSNAKEYAKKLPNLQLLDLLDIMMMVEELEPKQVHKILVHTFNTDIKIIRLKPCRE